MSEGQVESLAMLLKNICEVYYGDKENEKRFEEWLRTKS
jgi:hypothetical protein